MEAAYAERMFRWQDMAIGKIRERILDTGPNVLQGSLGVTGSLPRLGNDLLNLRTRIANFGRGQLNEELKRQE